MAVRLLCNNKHYHYKGICTFALLVSMIRKVKLYTGGAQPEYKYITNSICRLKGGWVKPLNGSNSSEWNTHNV